MDLGFLGGAEVDEYGNVNTTAIGDYLNPFFDSREAEAIPISIPSPSAQSTS